MPLSASARVPASTANLGPGFDCLGLALDLYNTVTLSVAAVIEVTVTGEGAGRLPQTRANLVLRAAARLAEEAGAQVPGWRLEQHNEIPLARGLGSSSAAIVAGLLACDRLLQLDTPTEDLLDLATRMEGHPDNVAPALYGGLTVCARDGEQTHCLRLPEPEGLDVAVVIPDFEVSTAEAREALPQIYPQETAVYNLTHACLTLAALSRGRYDLLGAAMQDRLHQPYRLPLVPGMARVIEAALEAGAAGAALSGSGPTVAAFCEEKNDAVPAAMQAAFQREGIRSRALWLKPSAGGLDLV
jgi:homoserine kinase